MTAAIENYILDREQGAVIVSKPASLKKNSAKKNNAKKTKSVFTNKNKYKQLIEEKKARNAQKRLERQLEKARREAELQQKLAAEIGTPAEASLVAETTNTVTD